MYWLLAVPFFDVDSGDGAGLNPMEFTGFQMLRKQRSTARQINVPHTKQSDLRASALFLASADMFDMASNIFEFILHIRHSCFDSGFLGYGAARIYIF